MQTSHPNNLPNQYNIFWKGTLTKSPARPRVPRTTCRRPISFAEATPKVGINRMVKLTPLKTTPWQTLNVMHERDIQLPKLNEDLSEPYGNVNYHRCRRGVPLSTAFMFCESLKQTKCTRVLPFGYTAKTLVPIFLLQREHILSPIIFTNVFRWLQSSSLTCFQAMSFQTSREGRNGTYKNESNQTEHWRNQRRSCNTVQEA